MLYKSGFNEFVVLKARIFNLPIPLIDNNEMYYHGLPDQARQLRVKALCPTVVHQNKDVVRYLLARYSAQIHVPDTVLNSVARRLDAYSARTSSRAANEKAGPLGARLFCNHLASAVRPIA